MIDNYARTFDFMNDMEACLPIPVRPTPELAESLMPRADQLPPVDDWHIESVHYLGDEGGISCRLRVNHGVKEAIVVSLTHLRIDFGHPLAQSIREYQRRRVKWIRRLNRDACTTRKPGRSASQREKRRKPR